MKKNNTWLKSYSWETKEWEKVTLSPSFVSSASHRYLQAQQVLNFGNFLGIDYKIKKYTIDSDMFKLFIWDTAG